MSEIKKKPSLAVFSLVIIVFLVLAALLFKVSLFTILLGLILYAVVLLNLKYPVIEKIIGTFVGHYLNFSLALLFSFLPAYFFRWLTGFFPSLPDWLQIIVLVLWFILLFVAIRLLILEKNREKFLGGLKANLGWFAPFAYSHNLMWIGIFFFSSLTYSLIQNGTLAWLDSANQADPQGAIMDFYLWHFINTIPGYKVTDTLLWEVPLKYDSVGVGWLLLAFKIAVISPIIGAFIWYWRDSVKEKKGEQEKPKLETVEEETMKLKRKVKKTTRRTSGKARRV